MFIKDKLNHTQGRNRICAEFYFHLIYGESVFKIFGLIFRLPYQPPKKRRTWDAQNESANRPDKNAPKEPPKRQSRLIFPDTLDEGD
jgi:hypothetical protein